MCAFTTTSLTGVLFLQPLVNKKVVVLNHVNHCLKKQLLESFFRTIS